MKLCDTFKINGLCFPWVEYVVDYKGNVHKVCCAICSKVESKEKLFILKLNNLLKHVGCHKGKVVSLAVEVSVLNFNGKCEHA
jgi:hypothetical protein